MFETHFESFVRKKLVTSKVIIPKQCFWSYVQFFQKQVVRFYKMQYRPMLTSFEAIHVLCLPNFQFKRTRYFQSRYSKNSSFSKNCLLVSPKCNTGRCYSVLKQFMLSVSPNFQFSYEQKVWLTLMFPFPQFMVNPNLVTIHT